MPHAKFGSKNPARALAPVRPSCSNNFKLRSLREDQARQASPAVVTHTWTENGVERTKDFTLDAADEYEIVAGADPINQSIKIAVPSDGPVEVALAPRTVHSDSPDWVEPMRTVHARFQGERGTFAQFGDSITDSRVSGIPFAGNAQRLSRDAEGLSTRQRSHARRLLGSQRRQSTGNRESPDNPLGEPEPRNLAPRLEVPKLPS